MDNKVTYVSSVVDETKEMIVDGVKGTKLDSLTEVLLIIYDREGAEESDRLAKPNQSSRYPCRCFKKTRARNWRMVSGGRDFQKLEAGSGNLALALRRG